MELSLVIPLLDESESLPELSGWIEKVCTRESIDYELIFVDDGSKDNSWEIIKGLSAQNWRIKGIRFNRNYGKSAALNEGFKVSSGEVVITMDADLQDSPEEIPDLLKMIKEDGFDMVSGWKKKRYDPISKTIPSKVFNYFTSLLSGIKLHDFNCGLKAYHRNVIKNITVQGEMHRYIPVIAKWQGFGNIGEKIVSHQARKYGETKFGLERFINGFLDLLSITFVSKFKKRPMHFFGMFGTLSFAAGFIMTAIILWNKFNSIYILHEPIKREITEQPLFFIALVAVLIGVQLFLAGFLAELISLKSGTENDYLVIEKEGIDD